MLFANDLFASLESSEPSTTDGAPSTGPRTLSLTSDESLSKEQIVDRIIVINPTATGAFLDQFAEPELRSYLEHLDASQRPRGRDATWSRPPNTPAVTVRRAG